MLGRQLLHNRGFHFVSTLTNEGEGSVEWVKSFGVETTWLMTTFCIDFLIINLLYSGESTFVASIQVYKYNNNFFFILLENAHSGKASHVASFFCFGWWLDLSPGTSFVFLAV